MGIIKMPDFKEYKTLYESLHDTMFLFDWNDGNVFSMKVENSGGAFQKFCKFDSDINLKTNDDGSFKPTIKTKCNLETWHANPNIRAASEIKAEMSGKITHETAWDIPEDWMKDLKN